MENNALKTFVFIFDVGNKLAWSGDELAVLIDRATPNELEGLRNWMERCEPGWIYALVAGIVVCSGFDEEAKSIQYFEDDGHGLVGKSKGAFLTHREDVGPVQEVNVSWDENDTQTLVIGKNGNVLALSGFGVGFHGEEESEGLIWLLDMCGVGYNKEDVTTINVDKFRSVSFQSMYQTATGIDITSLRGHPNLWSAKIEVQCEFGNPLDILITEKDRNGEDVQTGRILRHNVVFSELDKLIDRMLLEASLRGITWTADPRLKHTHYFPIDILSHESDRIGWNYKHPR